MQLLFLLFVSASFIFTKGQDSICEDGWIYNDGHCYWSSFLALEEGEPSRLANWFGAQLQCRSMHSELVYLNSSFEISLVQSLAGCGPTWLGMVYSDVFSTDINGGKFVWWRNNEEAIGYNISQSEDSNCTSHRPTAVYTFEGNFIADYPDSLYPFVCKKISNGRPAAGNCDPATLPSGFLDEDSTCCDIINHNETSPRWFYHDHKCYLYINQSVDYFAAQLSCQENNMHLASILNQTQNQVVGVIAQCGAAWIGLENISPKEQCHPDGWAWEDFSGPLSKTGYVNNWFKGYEGQPSCDLPYQNAYIVPFPIGVDLNAYYWLSYPSYAEIPFICAHKLRNV